MKKIVKKLINYFFKKSPSKIVTFESILSKEIATPIDIPENLTTILKKEKGEPNYFEPFVDTFNCGFKWREISGVKRYKNGGIFSSPDRTLYSLEKGIIFGTLGLIYEPKNKFVIDESAKEWVTNLKKHPMINALFLPKVVQKNGIALSLATVGADGGYFHFLHEAIIKLFFCKDVLPYVDYLVVQGPALAWKEKWLKAAGVNPEKIIWLEANSHYQFDQLLFTNRLIHDQQFTDWSMKALKSLYKIDSVASEKPYRIVWCSRKSANHRVFKWENEVKQKFPEIEFIDFTQLSAEETIKVCKETKLFIGPHGAGFSNLVFCMPGTKVLEIFPNENFQPLYNRLSQKNMLRHAAIILDFENNSSYSISFLNKTINELTYERKNSI